MKAPRVAPVFDTLRELEGANTYALRGIRGYGVENQQGFSMIPPYEICVLPVTIR